jgi:SSS family transporter
VDGWIYAGFAFAVFCGTLATLACVNAAGFPGEAFQWRLRRRTLCSFAVFRDCVHMGVALYTAAWVLRGILGLKPGATIMGIDALILFIVVLGLLTGLYTILGGLLAVVWTESVQAILLFAGAVSVTLVGYIKVGGWSMLARTIATPAHPLAGVAGSNVNWGTGNFLNMARTASDPSGLAWYSILLGYSVLGIWYWCCDQTIVQRVLAAKDERQARLGPLFCAFLKIFPVFVFVLPGVICVALVQQGAFGGDAPLMSADTYTFMLTHLLPAGLKRLVAAAMLAAAMQSCSAALNSTATLVAYDLFKRHNPAIADHKLVTKERSRQWWRLSWQLGVRPCSAITPRYSARNCGRSIRSGSKTPRIRTTFLDTRRLRRPLRRLSWRWASTFQIEWSSRIIFKPSVLRLSRWTPCGLRE